MVDQTEAILKKYQTRLEGETQEYRQFKQDLVPDYSFYEKYARSLGNLIHISIATQERERIQAQLKEAHLSITPEQATGVALTSFVGVFLLTLLTATSIYFFTNTIPFLFVALGLLAGLFTYYYTTTIPARKAQEWKLQAAAQMVPAILYTVIYMKHTSNLERAIEFTASNIEGPLAYEFKKVIYDVEIGKYHSLKQAIDIYLEQWKDFAPEFVESFHLIEASLYEPSEARRIQILEKSLQVILDGVYEKMLKYSREIRTPLTNVYMLGIILPTLGLAMLPLASALLGGLIQWYHIILLFNILIPFGVFYLTSQALLKRPGGHGESAILRLNPHYATYADNRPWLTYLPLVLLGLLIGALPFLMQTPLATQLGLKHEYTLGELGLPVAQDLKLFDFKTVQGKTVGPFSPIGVLLSFMIPLTLALYFSLVYRKKTFALMQERDKTKVLEAEFTNSLFSLGNRLADNIPAEIAFAKVAEATQHQQTHDFFALVNTNIQQAGLSVEAALFDKRRGACIYYPSALIRTSMRILVESTKKGLQVAAQALMSISEYVKNITKINQRLQDLLAEIIADMKSNMTFLAPLLAGIVVGLGIMITTILNKLESLRVALPNQELGGFGTITDITRIFSINEMIPPYYIQLAIGMYMIEIVFILTITLVTVDAGKDTLRERAEFARNIKTSLIMYTGTAFLATLALTALATIALSSLG